MRWVRAGGQVLRDRQVRQAEHAHVAVAPGLRGKPFGHVVGVARFFGRKFTPPHAEGCAAAAHVHNGDDIAICNDARQVREFVHDGEYSARCADIRAVIAVMCPDDGQRVIDRDAIDGRPDDVNGQLCSVPHGDILRLASPFAVNWLRIAPVFAKGGHAPVVLRAGRRDQRQTGDQQNEHERYEVRLFAHHG